MNVSILS